jgi:predicted GTPase
MSQLTRVVIVGAAGRDFHNFNVVYRDDARFEVVAFTAAQIPNIAGRRYPPQLGPVLPAMGYSPAQLEALARSIDAAPADVVVSGTPIDLAALVRLAKPVVRARYEFADVETPGLGGEIDRFAARADT